MREIPVGKVGGSCSKEKHVRRQQVEEEDEARDSVPLLPKHVARPMRRKPLPRKNNK